MWRKNEYKLLKNDNKELTWFEWYSIEGCKSSRTKVYLGRFSCGGYIKLSQILFSTEVKEREEGREGGREVGRQEERKGGKNEGEERKEETNELRINVEFGKVFTDNLTELHSPIKI